MLGANLPHCWKNLQGYHAGASSIVIQWRGDIFPDIPAFAGIQKLQQQAQRGLYLAPKHRTAVSEQMKAVVSSENLTQYLRFVELLDFIAEQVTYTPIAGASYTYDFSSRTTSRIEQVQTYVKEHFARKIKLSEVADHLNMSEQSFSRFFSKAMQRPFFVFLNEYRVNMASRLILETDFQMAQIAYQCGYESLPFFYKQFKKFKGYSPLEFRKMYQKI
ncbi:AraC-like DNA-binding protein [Marinoscillum furvescens DSM 4134]|uniref:AraC-like DNA-binding protein n=2 Tax=Marinoscillum furvescens TaxID=1026 RepID=A0A3D9KYS0_MARFU|nr:AraC-like DNA-binding protein [Marinoscillum furvescens DSM 4134]